jgi:hypothetical protein
MCVCGGLGFNGFVIKVQPFLMDGHYKMDIISGVGVIPDKNNLFI